MKQPSVSTRSPIRAGMQEGSLTVTIKTPEGWLFDGKAGKVTCSSQNKQI